MNKVKYNLKNVHVALQNKTAPGVYSYATPVALPGAVSISLNAEGSVTPFYADGVVYFRTNSNNGYSGDLEIALITDWFRQNVLQEKLDSNGVLVEKSDSLEPVYFALLFEFDGDEKAIRHALYNCSISSRPTVESETKKETIEPGTETLSLTADPRDDGLVKARTGDNTTSQTYNAWYSSVYVPIGEAVPVTGITLSEDTLSLNLNGAQTLTATVAPSGATNPAVIWSSSDAGVASVANGVVTAVSVGTATIKATAADGSGVSASCAVTVANG